MPDLRPTITYDKNRKALDFAATITSDLMPNESDRPEGRSQINDIAGAGLIRKPATVDKPRTVVVAHRIEDSYLLGESGS